MTIEIEKINHNGEGIGKIENKIIFIPKTIPNDIVTVKNIKDYGNYLKGEVKDFIKHSPIATASICPYYDKCGGCQIMTLTYKDQLEYKKNKVIDIFNKYCHININPEIEPSNQYKYRNKVIFHVKDGKIGYFEENSNNFLQIDKCIILNDRINNIITTIKNNLCLDNVNKIMIRDSQDKIMIVFYGNIIIKDTSIFNDNIIIYINNKKLIGDDNIVINFGKYNFTILPEAFFQVNTPLSIKLYKYIKNNITPNDKVLDLYCGVGSIGIFCSDKCKKVEGIEINKSAIINANINKKINNINNITFKCLNANKIQYPPHSFDTIIVDPPRGGLDKKTINIINNIKSNKIIYISCNPITLARDINQLKENYNINSIKLFDMFPNSYHVESVVCLTKI